MGQPVMRKNRWVWTGWIASSAWVVGLDLYTLNLCMSLANLRMILEDAPAGSERNLSLASFVKAYCSYFFSSEYAAVNQNYESGDPV